MRILALRKQCFCSMETQLELKVYSCASLKELQLASLVYVKQKFGELITQYFIHLRSLVCVYRAYYAEWVLARIRNK